jgi:hypothetical protein
MPNNPNKYLIVGAALSAVAAALHLACIVFGAEWYRAMGAGEQMAELAAAGSSYPTKITLFITGILMLWSLYALSGSGVIPRLPFLRLVLCAITAVYLLRGFGFFALMTIVPGRSMTFWLWSSAICAVFGVIHAIGLKTAWSRLK